jgi:hypothetical protein
VRGYPSLAKGAGLKILCVRTDDQEVVSDVSLRGFKSLPPHMTINKEWHLKHKMPKNPSMEERIAWHKEHAKHCSCMPIPVKLAALMKKTSA